MRDKEHCMDYLLYQTKDGTLKKKEITNRPLAEQIVAKAESTPVKLEGQEVHIVGIGSLQDYESHRKTLGQNEPTGYMKFKASVAYYKEHGKWPE